MSIRFQAREWPSAAAKFTSRMAAFIATANRCAPITPRLILTGNGANGAARLAITFGTGRFCLGKRASALTLPTSGNARPRKNKTPRRMQARQLVYHLARAVRLPRLPLLPALLIRRPLRLHLGPQLLPRHLLRLPRLPLLLALRIRRPLRLHLGPQLLPRHLLRLARLPLLRALRIHQPLRLHPAIQLLPRHLLRPRHL